MKLLIHNDSFISINLNAEEFDNHFKKCKNFNSKNPFVRFAVNDILRKINNGDITPQNYENFNIKIGKNEYTYFIRLFKTESLKKYSNDVLKKWLLCFYNFDNMISTLSELYKKEIRKGILYHNKNGYQMVINAKKSKLEKINKFCTITDSKLAIAKITEYSNKICENNVIEKIVSAFSKN